MTESTIRKLAKSIEMQTIFRASKEMYGVSLFNNHSNFSRIQTSFISYLYFYDMIYRDVALKEVPEYVLKKELYEDAYLLYKQKNIKKDKKNSSDAAISISFGKKIIFPKASSEVK